MPAVAPPRTRPAWPMTRTSVALQDHGPASLLFCCAVMASDLESRASLAKLVGSPTSPDGTWRRRAKRVELENLEEFHAWPLAAHCKDKARHRLPSALCKAPARRQFMNASGAGACGPHQRKPRVVHRPSGSVGCGALSWRFRSLE